MSSCYKDQRENRDLIRRVSRGKRVLDTYCYSGGFSINAILGGAAHVVAVDSSQPALDLAADNLKLNGITRNVDLIKADAVEYMRKLQSRGEVFDLVICDISLFPGKQIQKEFYGRVVCD